MIPYVAYQTQPVTASATVKPAQPRTPKVQKPVAKTPKPRPAKPARSR